VVDPEAVAVGRLSSHTRRARLTEAVVVELVVGHGASGEVALVGDADAVVEVLAEVVAIEEHVLDAPRVLHADAVAVAAGLVGGSHRAPVLPAVAVDDVIDELDAADLGHPGSDVDAVALGTVTGLQQGWGRAVLGDALAPLGVVADDDVLAQAAAIVELDAVARVLMDDVAIDQGIADLQDALIEGDPVRLTGCNADLTGAEDLIVDDPDLFDRPGVAEVDIGRLRVASCAEVSVITLHVDIEGVAINDHVAVQAAAADGPNGVPEDQAAPAVLAEGVVQDTDGVDRRCARVPEDHALFIVIEEAVVLDSDVLLSIPAPAGATIHQGAGMATKAHTLPPARRAASLVTQRPTPVPDGVGVFVTVMPDQVPGRRRSPRAR
jgi:hypothetical protein